jgi:hypothetical protein
MSRSLPPGESGIRLDVRGCWSMYARMELVRRAFLMGEGQGL